MPDALELPGVLRAVVPLVRGERFTGFWRDIVDELVALAFRHRPGLWRDSATGRFPRVAAIAGALDHLPEPATRLRRIDAIGIGGGSFEVIDLPSREVRPAHGPALTFAVRGQKERALPSADQDSHAAHDSRLHGTRGEWGECRGASLGSARE